MAALLAVLTLAASPAAADDSALNKEGFWTVGRGDDGAKGCMASIHAQDGTMLLVQVAPGHVDVVVGTEKAMRPGKTGTLSIDAESFDFRPDYTDGRNILFFEDAGARALAALRTARNVAVRVDGRELVNVSVENTGLEGALDAVTACSKGDSGWWGPGVGAPATAKTRPAANKENIWFLERGEIAELCTAYAATDGRVLVVLLADAGKIGVAVKSSDNMRRGRKGLLEADSVAIPFKPIFDGATYFSSDESLDASALAAVRNAKTLRLSIEGRAVVDASVEGTGLPALLDDLAACSKGAKGWWGEGARPRPALAPAPPGSSSSP